VGYTELLRRAAEIAWRRRWLWLLALFAGESGGGLSGGSRGVNVPAFSPGGGGGGGPASQPNGLPDIAPFAQWVTDHVPLLVAIGIALLLFYAVLFVISCISVGATIRGVEEIDAGRPVGLGRAWGLGAARFGPVFRLRLLLLLLGVVATLLGGGLVLLGVLAVQFGAWAALAIVIYQGAGLIFELFLVALVLGVLLPVAVRAVVLDALGAVRGLVRAYRLLLARPARVLACWGLMLGCQIAYGIALGIGILLLVLPAIALLAAVYAGGHLAATIVAGIVIGVVVLAAVLVASAPFAAFYSSFWTLAYGRLERA
jgi:hypothetical protein